ncbi:MAG: glycosyltransferase [Lachnospiraceae bacterium]
MRFKFFLSVSLGVLWLVLSCWLAVFWAEVVSCVFPGAYVWWVIVGIALLPGFMMSSMFFSNLLNWRRVKYTDTAEDTTVIMCAHNEEKNIARSIRSVFEQCYAGHIRLIVVDNASDDRTGEEIVKMKRCCVENCSLEYVFCGQPGKAHALNCGLEMVCTPHFITVDGDTCLEKRAVQRIMNHITARKSACVAGNLFVQNAGASLAAKMQNYDYLLSIAAIKRFQGSYRSTLVAQGAFSAFDTCEVRRAGGWRDVMGEDIVLTYQLLARKLPSTYEPGAVGYTMVPETVNGLYNQRKRWAIGMLEGLSAVPPWRQGTVYSRYFTSMNVAVIYLDLAFLFGLIPGIIMALFGYFYFAGALTLFALAVGAVFFLSIYIYQAELEISFKNSFCGFLCFLLLFQVIQSTAALHGYLSRLLHRKGEWV